VKTVSAVKPNEFQCIDDTQFKLFTGTNESKDFVLGSCPKGFCVTRNPPNKNPCIGKAKAARIDGVVSEEKGGNGVGGVAGNNNKNESNDNNNNNNNSPQVFGANTFQCIDDTQFMHFTDNNGNFIMGSCPKGFCATRTPPIKNPCVGKENAARIDGTANATGLVDTQDEDGVETEVVDSELGGAFGGGGVDQELDDVQGAADEVMNEKDNTNASGENDNKIDESTEEQQDNLATTSSSIFTANTFQCIDDTQFKHFTDNNGNFIMGSCPKGFCATRNPPIKNPCIGKENAARIDSKVAGTGGKRR
jgi:hypothetical protein